ncbi:MAG: Sir2 family NAD-dependent protein deacetylase [Thermomicrobiales bacterium]
MISHRPNVGHLAITRLFDSGIVSAVVTQNIDGLHQEAGVPDRAVIELHGSARRVHCLDCGRVWDGREIQQRQDDGEELPICRNCGGPMRAQTVLFGESLPPEALRRAIEIARTCELMLVVGSSLVVQPAASVPLEAVRKGIPMAIINLSTTPLDDLATIRVPLPAGATLTTLAEALTDTQR